MAHDATAPRPIRPRSPGVVFDPDLPRHWLGGSGVATQLVNGVNLLFPAGERFFIRSVQHYLPRIQDPELKAQVRGFFGQEAQHAAAHERFFDTLEAQGYPVKPLLRAYEHVAYGWIEPATSPALRLATTVALEHFTALLAEGALTDGVLERAHPSLRQLLMWHAAEEIEHKSVAYDVFDTVDGRYAMRMAGLLVAVGTLGGFWAVCTAVLLVHDMLHGERATFEQFRQVQNERPIGRRIFLRGIREYLRRDFHPSQNDNAHLAREHLARAGYAPA